jgi:transposase InsO family protein
VWEQRYNYDRFSLALQGRTPAEKLQAVLASRVVTTHIQENVQ